MKIKDLRQTIIFSVMLLVVLLLGAVAVYFTSMNMKMITNNWMDGLQHFEYYISFKEVEIGRNSTYTLKMTKEGKYDLVIETTSNLGASKTDTKTFQFVLDKDEFNKFKQIVDYIKNNLDNYKNVKDYVFYYNNNNTVFTGKMDNYISTLISALYNIANNNKQAGDAILESIIAQI